MKRKLLLLVHLTLFSILGFSQVTFYVNPPSVNSGNYANTYADSMSVSWNVPNLVNPANAVNGTLVLANDSLACTTLTNPLDVSGKIAVIYRGGCGFSTKALNAQNAGAIAVVIINHTGSAVPMGGGSDGTNVTIPVIMISEQDGALLHDEIVAGTTTCFIGNKSGYYSNDIGIRQSDVLRAKSFSNIQNFSQNASEFLVETGALIWNFGTNDQTDVILICNINFNGVSIYNEVSAASSIASGDSLFVSFPAFSQSTYSNGLYNMTYTVSSNSIDQFIDDNQITANFMMTDNMWSRATSSIVTNKPVSNTIFYAGGQSQFRTCTQFSDPNASRKGALGLTFSSRTNIINDGVHLNGKLVTLEAYKWNDPITNINDTGFLTDANGSGILQNLELVTTGSYNYTADLQGVMISADFSNPFLLNDNQHYLFCIVTEDDQIQIGADTKIDYRANIFNEANVGSPTTNDGNIVSPIYNDNGWFAIGYGTNFVAAIGLNLFPAPPIYPDNSALSDIVSICILDTLTPPTANSGTITGTTATVFPINIDSTIIWTFNDSLGNTFTQTQDIIINPLDISVTQNGNFLASNSSNYNYQWINCNTGNSIIDGQTNETFTPTIDGSYAVIVDNGICIDTSLCYNVIGLSINKSDFENNLTAFPNPTNGEVIISLGDTYTTVGIKITNALGQEIETYQFKNQSEIKLTINDTKGVYFIHIKAGNKAETSLKIIKE